MARRLWRHGRGPRAFPTRKSRKPGDASNSSGVSFPPVETMVQAVPDQVAVLDFGRSPMGRHDFHIVAIRRIRCDRIWGLLSPAVQNASDPVAGCRELVLLRLRPAGTSAASGRRGFRNLSAFYFGVAESADMV